MNTADEDLDGIARSLLAKVDPDATLCDRVQTRDYDLNKVYDVHRVDACIRGAMRHFVMKRSASGYEAGIYRNLLGVHDLPVPHFHADLNMDGVTWFLSDLLAGSNMQGGTLEQFRFLAVSLARVHSLYWGNDFLTTDLGVHSQLDQIARSITTLGQHSAVGTLDITPQALSVVYKALDRLRSGPLTLIHGDLLPINVIYSQGAAVIIDWENCAWGHYASDLGRLLGDLKDEHGRYWVMPEWHDDIMRTYHNAMTDVAPTLTWSDLATDVGCGRLWNYLCIVLAHLSRGWEKGAWYYANLSSLERAAANLRGLL